MTGLAQLNQMAHGTIGKDTDTLAHGWGGAMLNVVKNREEELSRTGYKPEDFANKDPEMVDKEAAANMLQNMIHGSLNKEE